LVGKPNEINHLEELDVDGRIILKYILKIYDGRAWTGLMWLRIKNKWRACFEQGNEHWGSLDCPKILD
jgi:hypothetical protein